MYGIEKRARSANEVNWIADAMVNHSLLLAFFLASHAPIPDENG